ncbi:MAG: bifunctional oligoribonuclease/PAP phosphatase NrnA [Defluviitaleaceae bacterium]|nr:bifunctional oligoribonuclease/PAP phosphatase NrnA [Defluviitaleaceae bacterium]
MIQEILERIKAANKIGICGHTNPDGDSIGSCFALANTLYRIGKTPYVYLDENKIKFDSGAGRQFISNKTDIDLFISVDTANIERVDVDIELFKSVDNIVIDHHTSNNGFGTLNLINDTTSSTCEVLYFVINKLVKIDRNIASWLYTGLITDTDNFSHPNTTPTTLRIGAYLMEIGIDSSKINFFWVKSRPLKLFKNLAALSTKLEFIKDLKVVYILVDIEYMQKNNISIDDINSVSSVLNVIPEAEIAISLREIEKNITRVSFRSKRFNVDNVASYFGGGGHHLAAACTIELHPKEAIEKVLDHLRLVKENSKAFFL